MKHATRPILALAATAAAAATLAPSGLVAADNASPTLLNNVVAQLEPTSATPYGRVVNNTIVGAAGTTHDEGGFPVIGDWDGDEISG